MDLLENIISGDSTPITISDIEKVCSTFPYFQAPKSLLLKKMYNDQHYRYNNTLKWVAAYTTDRSVLFDYITSFTPKKELTVSSTEKPMVANLTKVQNQVSENTATEEALITTITKTPFEFNTNEKHSFQQWLQLSSFTPIQRDNEQPIKPFTAVETPKEVQKSPIQNKLNIINQFIQNNPRIEPIKKNGPIATNLTEEQNQISNELMTETLAKVYISQKKYENAILAYKILSLKYPEKSGLFADQIKIIKNLQNHKS